MRHLLYLLGFILLFQSCDNTRKFTGFSYDPEGVTITTDKPIHPQHKRTIGIAADGVWVTNEYEGARLNDFFKLNDTLYQVTIEPENHPINNSPWYSFKIKSDREKTIWIKLTYIYGTHRYYPKLSHDGHKWHPINTERYYVDTAEGVAYLQLDLSPQYLWVSAQELYTPTDFYQWADSLSLLPYISQYTAGYSHQHRPIQRLTITEENKKEKKGVLIIIGRQHPPEVTGYMACMAFIEELASDTELAHRFRQEFEVIAYPFMNPDGAAGGHWRHNAGGVDLNRDWINFNQPETRAVRNDLLKLLRNNPYNRAYYGIDFHSTDHNVFFPINRDVKTFPEDFTYHWIATLKEKMPEYNLAVKPFPTEGPIAKNWMYHAFGIDALTYEVADYADRQEIKDVAQISAKIIMKQLLEKKAELHSM